MSNSLSFKIKSDVDIDKHRLLEFFFKVWVDSGCNKQVKYSIERGVNKTFSAHFEKSEDALALTLRGVPLEFEKYLEIVNRV